MAVSFVFFEAAKGSWNMSHKAARASTLVSALLGASLFLGLFTQGAAFAGILTIFVLSVQKKVPSVFHKKTFTLLVLAILISLMLTGAGGLAVDLPY